MGNFFSELRRRHIYRMGAGYVIVAWAITQVLDVLSQLFALPDSVAQPAVIVLVVGFPVTLVIAWLIEGKAHAGETGPVSPATKLDWLIAGGLAVVIGLIGYQQLTPENAAVVSTDQEVEEVSEALPNSVAILLFDNLSPNLDDAYFAAGVHESILNELVKIRDMNVIARTSVLRYADTDLSIPEIANELNVETVMEGSVRYAGDQVRVTAQLIDPGTGAHIWSEEYDRARADIFAIQSDIAERIAMALEAELLPAERESIERPPTDSPDAYEAFLKAMAGVRGGFEVSALDSTRSIIQSYLDQALELDPDFALAHAWKARIYTASRLYNQVPKEDWSDFRSEMHRLVDLHAAMALMLDPNLGLAHAVRAEMHLHNWNGQQAQLEAGQALQLSPNDTEALRLAARIAVYVLDQYDEAFGYLRRAAELDPDNAAVLTNIGISSHAAGMYTQAIEAEQDCLALDPTEHACSIFLAQSQFALGNRGAALDALRLTEQIGAAYGIAGYGFGVIGQPQDAQRLFENITDLASETYVDPVALAVAHMGIGDYDEALNLMNMAAENYELVQDPYVAHFIRLNFLVRLHARTTRMG